MNLHDTVQALEAKNITVALDIGVHKYCDLNSNCPLAVQLRRLIADAGVTLEELLEGWERVTALDPVDYVVPAISSELSVNIMGKALVLDLGDVLAGQLADVVRRKIQDLESLNYHIRSMGRNLFNSYLHEIGRLRDDTSLPMLGYLPGELISTGCLTTHEDRNYIFLLPTKYNPQYLIQNGIRYKMSDEDIEFLERQIYLKFTVNQSRGFIRADVLDSSGEKLRHYHGSGSEDCWGQVRLPRHWDGGLRSLVKLTRSLTMSLITLDLNSLMSNNPSGMLQADCLLARSTKLGREGEVDIPEVQEQPTERPGWGRNAWGRGR